MGKGEPSGSGGRNDGRVRLATMAGAVAGMAVPVLGAAWADLPRPGGLRGFVQGLIMLAVGYGVGAFLGRLAGERLFRRSSSGPPDHLPPRLALRSC
jgi:hypothetical protein